MNRIIAIVMAFMMSNVPHVAAAESQMLSTAEMVTQIDRARAEERVGRYLQMDEVKKALSVRGISPEEMSSRLASLSDHELNQMADQMDQARYGGDILIVILVVVLIIFLVKRI
jgi:hypothetical protein